MFLYIVDLNESSLSSMSSVSSAGLVQPWINSTLLVLVEHYWHDVLMKKVFCILDIFREWVPTVYPVYSVVTLGNNLLFDKQLFLYSSPSVLQKRKSIPCFLSSYIPSHLKHLKKVVYVLCLLSLSPSSVTLSNLSNKPFPSRPLRHLKQAHLRVSPSSWCNTFKQVHSPVHVHVSH